MPLLNYTTSIAVDKTVGEIHAKLAKAGAHQILNEYSAGAISAVSFRIMTKFGDIAFRLPAHVEAVEALLKKQRVTRRSYGYRRKVSVNASSEQAARVAWRIIKDWIEAQLALLETGQVTLEQVFLAYMQDSKGETLYEAIERKRFSGYALTYPKNEIDQNT